MSWQATAMAWSIGGLDPSRRLVLLAVANYASETGKRIFPGIERLAHDTSLSESTVKRSLATLVEDGYLVLVRVGSGRGMASLYNMPIDFDRIRDFQKRGQIKSISDDEKEVTDEKKGVIDDKEGGHSELLTIQEDSTKRESNILNVEFDEFWKKYPYRVAATGARTKNGKPAAKKQFALARKKVPFETILGALSRCIMATDPKYVPDAERWLKHGRWEDEFLNAEPKKHTLFGPSL